MIFNNIYNIYLHGGQVVINQSITTNFDLFLYNISLNSDSVTSFSPYKGNGGI